MPDRRKIRFIEPAGRPGRPMNAWIAQWPLLGPITLATILDHRGFDAQVYNENVSGPLEDNDEAYADVCSADVVGVSIMTPTASRGYALTDRLRRDAPGVTIAFGGSHATFRPEEALAYGDVVVRGEGETVIEAIADGTISSGIIDAEPLADLDEIPTLNHFLMRDFDKILAQRRKRPLYELPVMTSRGCPYGCTYCSVTRMFGRQVRRQSVEKVYHDLCHYKKQGFTHFFFYDDNFTTDRAWSRELLAKMRPLRVRFHAQSRVDFFWKDARRTDCDHALLKAMQQAGCDMLFIGYETIDEADAKAWHKGYHGDDSLVARLRADTDMLHRYGIWIHAMFVMGPQHTPRTARRIVDFTRQCEIETMQISILTPLPGTPMFDELAPHLYLDNFPADWDYFDASHCTYRHGRMGVEEFQKTVIDAFRRFYLLSGWNGRTLRSLAKRPISSLDKVIDLWNGIRIAKRLLRDWDAENEEFVQMANARLQGRLAASSTHD